MARVLIKALAGVLLVLFFTAGGYWMWSANQPVLQGSERFVVAPGDGVSKIARGLVDQGIIREPYSFILWSYRRGYTGSMKTGEYNIEPSTTLIALLEQFHQGDVIHYSVTLVEGWTFREFLEQLATQEKLRHTVRDKPHGEIMALLGQPELHPEGRFFPDTYVYSVNTTDLEILKQALHRMQAIVEDEWANRDPGLKLENINEALTLASIIEKETGKPEERTMISGVFHNRLDKGMRLQTDPTVIYGLGAGFDGNLKRVHLRTDTPYNTYTRFGLPPTPIANPGQESIQAALRPEETRALYFVSRGDGSHQFSETLEAHNQAVAKYQLGGRQKSKSSASAAQ